MKPKINLEKFICSYVKWNNIQDALKDQGLKCWNGEIVEIESEDERMKKEILDLVSISGNGNQFEEIKDWLEKQGKKSPFNKERLMEVAKPETFEEQIESWRRVCCIAEKRLKELLEKQDVQNLASSAKTCKNDTLYDLLNKMPSCITVDGIDYHFVMKKTSIYTAYYACYKGEEDSGETIFWMAGEPIELLTAMLEKLKEEGLLE